MNNPIIDNIYNQADMLLSCCDGIYEEYRKDNNVSNDELQLMRVIEHQAKALYLSIDLLKNGLKK